MIHPDTFVSVDIETTGLRVEYDEIIEIGAVRIERGVVSGEFSRLIRPMQPIPEFITNLTGIDATDVADAPPVGEVMPAFLDFLGNDTVLGQNVSFDISFLRKVGGYGAIGRYIDNIDLARVLLPQLPSYSLDSLIEFFSLDVDARHRALDDARLTAQVFLRLIDMLRLGDRAFVEELTRMSEKTGGVLTELLQAQLRERIEGGEHPAHPGSVPVTTFPVQDNVFGDFSGVEVREGVPDAAAADTSRAPALLDGDGPLAAMYPDYEERPGQIALARNIAGAFAESVLLLAEAGTGVGKSLAYLVPSILWADATGERVVVSTNTKNLQEQLFSKDIPLVSSFIGIPFRAVIVKGRGNYLCRTRWKRLLDAPDRYLSREEQRLVLPVASWLKGTRTGDLSETGFYHLILETGLLEKINSESSHCLGARCRMRDQCFVNRVRRAAQAAHVIVVNHSLVFSDMVADGGVLGTYGRLIFDEAHNIEKVATRYLGISQSYYAIRRVINRLHAKDGGEHGLLAVLNGWMDAMIGADAAFAVNIPVLSGAVEGVAGVRSAARRLFDRLIIEVRALAGEDTTRHEGKLRYEMGTPVFQSAQGEIDDFIAAVLGLVSSLGEVVLMLGTVPHGHIEHREETIVELEEIQDSLRVLLDQLGILIEAGGPNVYWFEFNETGSGVTLRINSAPLDVAEKLAVGLYDRMETVVMTSATLTVARSFSYLRRRLGLDMDTRDRVVEFIAESPFDHRRQAAVAAPSFVPFPKDERFMQESTEVIYALGSEVRRGMLVLFTSRGHLNHAYHELRERFARIGVTLLGQGIDGSRNLILRRFREETGSVLFGTDSFWEGVDVPGNALELVVITRLPFSVPTDPVVQARMEEIARGGGNPFLEYQVPEAAIKLRQGAGRLIRHRNDRGAIIILDKRIVTARYGAQFRRSLPGTTMGASDLPTLVTNINAWFGTESGEAGTSAG